MADAIPPDIKLEMDQQKRVSRPVARQVEQVQRMVAAEYVKLAGSLDNPIPPQWHEPYVNWVVELLYWLREQIHDPAPALAQAVAAGTAYGTTAAALGEAPVDLSAALRESVGGLRPKLREDVEKAALLVRTQRPEQYKQLAAALGKATHAVRRTEQTTRWAVNAAINEAVVAQADREGISTVWVAERNACFTCLAYAGFVTAPGVPFPAGLTFGDRSTVREPIMTPPAHPNCRCRVETWHGSAADVGPMELPAVLKREAERTVARGATDYESNPAMFRAVERLLDRGTQLPKSVRERAERDLERREFTRLPSRRRAR